MDWGLLSAEQAGKTNKRGDLNKLTCVTPAYDVCKFRVDFLQSLSTECHILRTLCTK